MVQDSSSDDNTATNKGVNVRSESFPVGIHKCFCSDFLDDPDVSSSVSTSNIKSITDVKNDIQNVLDLMGPSTPNLTISMQNTSSEADNEESVHSLRSKTMKSSPTTSEYKRTTFRTLESGENDCSIVADAGTLSSLTNTEKFEYVEYSQPNQAGSRICLNPECMCMMGYMNQTSIPVPTTCKACCSTSNKSVKPPPSEECKKKGILEWLKNKPFELTLKKSSTNPCELYKINISKREDDGGHPKRVVFDLVAGIPKPSSSTVATNTIRNPVEKRRNKFLNSIAQCRNDAPFSNCDCKDIKNLRNESITQEQDAQMQKHISQDSDGNTRVDFYYFDHGNAQYFHTTDTPPVMVCEIVAEKTEKYTTKFWAEFFATIHIAFSFCISFILQLFKFILYGIVRPLSVGLMQLSSDYCFKPFLTTLFNGLIQPFLIFLYNVATSLRDLCDPVAEGCGYFLRELAVLFRAIRLCTYKRNDDNCDCHRLNSNCTCNNKKCIC